MNLYSLFEHSDNVQEFQAGATIFSEGAPGEVMYVVLNGIVELRIQGALIEIVGPGEIIGEMALIDSASRSASAMAKSDCRLAAVDAQQFLFMVQQAPLFSLHVMQVLVDIEWSCAHTEPKG